MIPANSGRNMNSTNNEAKDAIKDEKLRQRRRAGLTDLSNAISTNLRISASAECEELTALRKPLPVVRAKSEERQPRHEKESSPEEESDENAAEEEEYSVGWIDPCPEYDYDAMNLDDPFQLPEYAMDIFHYYHHRELLFRASDYMPKHALLKKIRRAKIVDWFVRCQEDFEANHEVLYHSVKLFDLFMCSTQNMEEFHYIAAAAMIIAAKVDQQDPPAVDDFPDLTGSRKYSTVNAYERKMLKAFACDINFPLSYRFLRRYARTAGMDMQTLTLARYILETSLLFYEFICVPDSTMAAAALLLAIKMMSAGNWSLKLEKYSGYKLEHVEPLMWRLNHMMKMRPKVFPECKSVEQKYSHGVFFHVAGTRLLPDKRPRNEPVGPPPGLGFGSLELF